MQVCLRMYDLLVNIRRWKLNCYTKYDKYDFAKWSPQSEMTNSILSLSCRLKTLPYPYHFHNLKKVFSRSATLLKRDSNTGVFLWILQNLFSTFILNTICKWLLLSIQQNWSSDYNENISRPVGRNLIRKSLFLLFSFYF